MSSKLTAERLRQVLFYDPATGVFTWREKVAKKVNVGARAGRVTSNGYRVIGVHGEQHLEHRLAVLYVTGSWPASHVDHRRGKTADNRWSKIRPCTPGENHQNRVARHDNSTGLIGVGLHKATGRWQARIGHGGRLRFLGRFDTPGEAHEAYKAAKRALHTFNPEVRA